MTRRLREDPRRWLPELASQPPGRAEAAEILASFEAWDRLRSEQRLGVARARAAVAAGLRALLAPGR